jgi:hypothetical protein
MGAVKTALPSEPFEQRGPHDAAQERPQADFLPGFAVFGSAAAFTPTLAFTSAA